MERLIASGLAVSLVFAAAVATASPLAVCGFNSGEDGMAYALGPIAGQGSIPGDWAGAWTQSVATAPPTVFDVAAGGDEGVAGDQMLHLAGQTTSSYGSINRAMDLWLSDFELTFSIRADFDGNQSNLTSTQGLFLQSADKTKTMLSLKWEAPGFRINEGSWISMLNPLGTGEYKPLGQAGSTDWITMKITGDVVDDAGVALATPQFDVYWEKTDGTLGKVLSSTRYRSTDWATGGYLVGSFGISAPKMANAASGGFFDYDRISIVPEPMTLVLLGVGSLGLIRRKRA